MSGAAPSAIADLFRPILGDAHVLAGEDDRIFYSHDIAGPAPAIADAVLRPGTIDELRRSVRAATAAGIALYPRGGGMSYTGGYLPQQRPAAVLDLARLDRVRTIDDAGEVVVVEAGCTWRKLFDALAAHRVPMRVPSFGPLSGFSATVGGTVSQNGGFFGTGAHGPVGGDVLGISAVIADGSLLNTGHFAKGARHHGPDQTALLIGDCGAFGIKAEIALRILPPPKAAGYLSFAFETAEAWLRFQVALADLPGIGEAMGFDAVAHANLAKTGFTVLEGAGIAGDLLSAPGTIASRIAAVLKAARTGKAFVADLKFSAHVAIEAGSDGERDAIVQRAAGAALDCGGTAIPDVIPRVTRARPFRPIKALLGPDGENWLPVHGTFGLAEAQRALAGCLELLAQSRADMERHKIRATVLTVLSGRRIVIEPQFFWPDALSPFHRRACQANQVSDYGARPAETAARAAVHRLRQAMSDAMDRHGATHYQIGRYYRLPQENLPLLRALKRAVDPDNRINPGVLGL